MSKKIGEQSLLKYEKLYNWGRTLITSGVIQNEDKFPSENILQKKFGYSRQTVRTALNQLEAEGLIKRVKGSGTYVSYEGNLRNGERLRIGLILSYFSDYLFPRVYDGIDSVMKEAGYDIDVAVTKNRLNDEAIYLEGLLNGNVAGFIIEGTRSFFQACLCIYDRPVVYHGAFQSRHIDHARAGHIPAPGIGRRLFCAWLVERKTGDVRHDTAGNKSIRF